jgi:hypothetical protein
LLRRNGVPVLATGLAPELADAVANVGADFVEIEGRRLRLTLDLSRAPGAVPFLLKPG